MTKEGEKEKTTDRPFLGVVSWCLCLTHPVSCQSVFPNMVRNHAECDRIKQIFYNKKNFTAISFQSPQYSPVNKRPTKHFCQTVLVQEFEHRTVLFLKNLFYSLKDNKLEAFPGIFTSCKKANKSKILLTEEVIEKYVCLHFKYFER